MDRTMMSRVVVMLLLISGIHRVAGKCIEMPSCKIRSVINCLVAHNGCKLHHLFAPFSAESCVSSYALGMESRAISDYQITASDYYRDGNTANAPQNARLNNEDIIGKTIILLIQMNSYQCAASLFFTKKQLTCWQNYSWRI